MEHICVGIVAHVDSGKTTLSENILYRTGEIRQMGRVDHGNTFLDTYGLERERGITIFSKQAEFSLGDKEFTLLDTPGHVDFSAEMERTLKVIDYAILVVSGADGIQGHTLTLWKLLERYSIPTFIFINKMDQDGVEKENIINELQKWLSHSCIEMEENDEEIAMLDEGIMNYFLENNEITLEQKIQLIRNRQLFPCYFGSALKDEGVGEFLKGLSKYTVAPRYQNEFGAKIFKITRDSYGNRLTHLKVTGGALKVKDVVSYNREDDTIEEKIDQIRIYSGEKYDTVNEVGAGKICAVTGLSVPRCGEGLGAALDSEAPFLTPVLTYKIIFPKECDMHVMLMKLRQLEEEEPELHIVWNKELGEIHAQVMGEIEIEILKNIIHERFDVNVEFGEGSILYKESILESTIGVGHYEPLRHYAEVHLLLEPLEAGRGLVFETNCSEDRLNKNWQRLVLTHLEEKEHKGVLTGSAITDMKITLIAGKAHLKHTEGGDFRQATYRAVRHGLKKAKSVLLEPVYDFRLEIPQGNVGRALSDIQKMHGKNDLPDSDGDIAIITGKAPVSTMRGYQSYVNAYTGGRGKLFCVVNGYEPCHNEDEIVAAYGYDSESDMDNPTGSVFCAHGAGFLVGWQEVEDYMHIKSEFEDISSEEDFFVKKEKKFDKEKIISEIAYDENELMGIFERTYGKIDRHKDFNDLREYDRLEKERERLRNVNAELDAKIRERYAKKNFIKPKDKYLLVDGYNIIFGWDDLKELSKVNLDSARMKLMDIMCNYQGYKGNTVIIVFDAYKVHGGKGEVLKYNNIHVIFTKEAETADQYIEKAVHKLGKNNDVTVATSDALEQMIIWGEGAKRLSARELKNEIDSMAEEINRIYLS